MGLTPGRSPGQFSQPDRTGWNWGATTPFHPACPPSLPPSFLSLSALLSLLPPFAGSPALIKCGVSSKSARLPPPAPGARSPQTKLLSSAPPGSCHPNPRQPAGVWGQGRLPSASPGWVGSRDPPPKRGLPGGPGLCTPSTDRRVPSVSLGCLPSALPQLCASQDPRRPVGWGLLSPFNR